MNALAWRFVVTFSLYACGALAVAPPPHAVESQTAQTSNLAQASDDAPPSAGGEILAVNLNLNHSPLGNTSRLHPIVSCLGDSESGAFNGTDAWCDLWAQGSTGGVGYPFATSGSSSGDMATQYNDNVAGHTWPAMSMGTGTNDCFLAAGGSLANAQAIAALIAINFQARINAALSAGSITQLLAARIPPGGNAVGYDASVQRCMDTFNYKSNGTVVDGGLISQLTGFGGAAASTGYTSSRICIVDLVLALGGSVGATTISAPLDSGDGKHPNQAGKVAEAAQATAACGSLRLQ